MSIYIAIGLSEGGVCSAVSSFFPAMIAAALLTPDSGRLYKTKLIQHDWHKI